MSSHQLKPATARKSPSFLDEFVCLFLTQGLKHEYQRAFNLTTLQS